MLEAAIKALSQMITPPFRSVLLKSVGLALILIVLLAIGLYQAADWAAHWSGQSLEGISGTWSATLHTPLSILATVLSIASAVGIVVGAVFLMPAITALVASFFVDEIGELVEREYYAHEPHGRPLPLWQALIQGIQTALLSVLVYLLATPALFFAGLGALIFFFATAFLLGREYFELAAMRFRPPAEAKVLRKRNSTTVFVAGMFIAAFVSIPVVNLATPLFGMAFMVHMHKKIAARQAQRLSA